MFFESVTGLHLRAIGFAVAAALFWLQYFDLKDHLRREPRALLVLSYFLGIVAAISGLLLYYIVELAGGPSDPGYTTRSIFLYCFLVVGPLEEGVKFLVTRFIIFRSSHFDEVIDGLVYASAVSIGFAGFESLVYAQFVEWPEQIARALTAPLTHSLFASLWGFGAAIAILRSRSRRARLLWQILPFLAAVLSHAVYDYVLLAYDATYFAGALALLLWSFLILYARHVVRAEPAPALAVTANQASSSTLQK